MQNEASKRDSAEILARWKFGVVPMEQAIQLSGREVLQRMIDGDLPAPPSSKTALMWPVEITDDGVVFEGHPSADFLNPMGTVHGGWIAALLDSAMGCTVHATMKPGEIYTTLDLNTTYVRPVFPNSGPLRCEATLLHRGRSTASASGRIFDENRKLIAHGTTNCVIMKAETALRRPAA